MRLYYCSITFIKVSRHPGIMRFFRPCCCSSFEAFRSSCLRIVNASPVILLSLILGWAYWAYNFRLCWSLLSDGHILQGCIYIVLFQPIFSICIWCYWKVTNTSPGYTKDISKEDWDRDEEAQLLDDSENVRLLNQETPCESHDDERKSMSDAAVLLVDGSTPRERPLSSAPNYPAVRSITVKRCGAQRFCQKCRLEKYDRTHHCRTCKRCILKMDHHCPWVNNCVGFYNYKFFYLFLLYAALLCLDIFLTTLPPTIYTLNQPMGILGLDINWALLVFFSGVFGLFLIPFTIFHSRQLLINRTTIEFYEKSNYRLGQNERGRVDVMRTKYFNPWDVGYKSNFTQVMGSNSTTWFLPVGRPQGNGCQFPLSSYAYDTIAMDDDF